MRYAIGVDAGGTNLRVALLNEEGAILKKSSRVVAASRDVDSFFKELSVLIRETAGGHLKELAGIGLGLPGICDSEKGIVHQLPHYPSWRDVPAAAILKKEFSCPVLLDNDANFAAMGEFWKGRGASFRSFIMLTLGTGIGGGLFLDGKIWHGDHGFAGEVGHMTIEVDGRPCACGKKGCWETYAASQAVPKGKSSLELAQAAGKGEKEALKFWLEFGRYLGVGIANLAHITGVENYILGGAIANAAKFFLEPSLAEIRKGTYERLAKNICVASSTLGEEANLLGCGYGLFHL